jgi:hypothetical protein
MPPAGKTTNAKRYWIGIVTVALQAMPEKYLQQQVLDHIDALAQLHKFPRPADVTLKAYIKEITDSAADAPWMDEPWTLGAIGRLASLGIKLDAADIRAIMEVLGEALVYGNPITIRHAVWIARLRELAGSGVLSLYEYAGRYASAERAAATLNEPMNTSFYDAQLALRIRGDAGDWSGSVSWELVTAISDGWADQVVLNHRRSNEARYKYQGEHDWGTGPTDWLEDFDLEPFDDEALHDAYVLAIRVFNRSITNIQLDSKEIEARVREIHRLVSERSWTHLWKALDHKTIDSRIWDFDEQE